MSENNETRVTLITGASRGIGATTARILAARGDTVVVNYREKRKRAERLVGEIDAAGGHAVAVAADLTDLESVQRMVQQIADSFGRLDVLVLNASGGLERGASPGYAMSINCDAQIQLARAALPLMPIGGRIVFITSHQAHFVASKPVPAGYEPIAESKRAGEDTLRAMTAQFADRGVGLTVVSGDMIDGTIIVTLLERRDSQAVADRRDKAPLPTVEEFATAIADATFSTTETGHTIYVGGQDYLVDTHSTVG